MHKCVKRGDLIVPGYWIYSYNYTILKENNEPIKAGDKFLFCLYDAWDYYHSFCKKNKIEYFIVDSYPGKFGNCYDTNTYNKIKNVFGHSAYAKFEVTKTDTWYVYAKLLYKTHEYGYQKHKRDVLIGNNLIKDYEIQIPNYHFLTKAYQSKSSNVLGKKFSYVHRHEKVFRERFCENEPVRFRIDPVILHPEFEREWLSFGMKYWDWGMSKKGLAYASYKHANDIQPLDYNDDSDECIVFKDTRAKARYLGWMTYERRKPHRKSWKECTKKRKQWMQFFEEHPHAC